MKFLRCSKMLYEWTILLYVYINCKKVEYSTTGLGNKACLPSSLMWVSNRFLASNHIKFDCIRNSVNIRDEVEGGMPTEYISIKGMNVLVWPLCSILRWARVNLIHIMIYASGLTVLISLSRGSGLKGFIYLIKSEGNTFIWFLNSWIG